MIESERQRLVIGGPVIGGSAGSLLLINPANTLAQIAAGGNGEVLTMVGGLPAWAALPPSVTDHGALTGLTDDDHTQYLHLSGRTGGQVIGGNAHTGGGTYSVAIEAGLILGDDTIGVNHTANRILDLRSEPVGYASVLVPFNYAVQLGSLPTGASSGVLRAWQVAITGTPLATSGSWSASAGFITQTATIPTGVTGTLSSGLTLQTSPQETNSGTAGWLTILGVDFTALGPSIANTGHTSTLISAARFNIANRSKPATLVTGATFVQGPSGMIGAVTRYATINQSANIGDTASVVDWAFAYFDQTPANPTGIRRAMDIRSTLDNVYGGKSSLGHVNAPGAYADIAGVTSAIASFRVRTGTAPAAPNDGDGWHDSTRKALYANLAGITQNLVGCIFTQTADKTISNTTTETSLLGTGIGAGNTLPANFWTVGKTIRLHLEGEYDTIAALAGTLKIKIKFGAVALVTTGANALALSQAGSKWRLIVPITCRAVGATGTLQATTQWEHAESATIISNDIWWAATGPVAVVDTTAAAAVDATATFSVADAGNAIITLTATIEVLN